MKRDYIRHSYSALSLVFPYEKSFSFLKFHRTNGFSHIVHISRAYWSNLQLCISTYFTYMQGRIYMPKNPRNADYLNQSKKREVWESYDGYDIKCFLYITKQQYKHIINILSLKFYHVSSFLHKGESVTMFKRPCH